MVLKNREVRRAVAAGAILSAIGAAAAYGVTGMLLDGTSGTSLMLATTVEAARDTAVVSLQTSPRTVALVAACCALATGLIVTGVFTALTAIRYRALNDMAANLDRVLAGERDICLRDMREGELAILASEVDKVIARLNLTVDELQAEKLALSDALANISHQLKTPLTSIAISTELIRDRLAERGDAPEIVERLRLVQRLQGRVEDLVAALLKLARIDAGVIKLVKAPVDARELVRKSFEPLAVAFDIAGVDFETSIHPGAGYEGDLAWSVEALENILKNCMEHTPAGGTVRCARPRTPSPAASASRTRGWASTRRTSPTSSSASTAASAPMRSSQARWPRLAWASASRSPRAWWPLRAAPSPPRTRGMRAATSPGPSSPSCSSRRSYSADVRAGTAEGS